MKGAGRYLLLLVAFVLLVAADERQDAIDCVMRYVDVDPKDGCVDSNEVSRAKSNCLWFYERAGTPRVETIMRDCDFDENGCISAEDMRKSNATCIATPDHLDKLLNTFCWRAKENNCNA